MNQKLNKLIANKIIMKRTLKKITLTILSLCSICALGQETPKAEKIKEYSLTLTNISPFNISLKYKRQIKTKTFLKLGMVDISVNNSTNYPSFSSSYPNHTLILSAGLELGVEFRKPITDNFTFFHGPNVNFTYQTQISKTDNPSLTESQKKTTSQTYTGGASYTLGLLLQLNNHILLSAEINPGISETYRTFDNGQNPQFNSKSNGSTINFSTKFGFLSIIYRI